jgi:hypothetical protein
MPVKAGDIVKAVIVELSQVPGIATQVYAADRILQYVQDAFLLEIEEIWWPQYMQYFGPVALDGTTGIIVSDLTGPISSITDCDKCHRAKTRQCFRVAPAAAAVAATT